MISTKRAAVAAVKQSMCSQHYWLVVLIFTATSVYDLPTIAAVTTIFCTTSHDVVVTVLGVGTTWVTRALAPAILKLRGRKCLGRLHVCQLANVKYYLKISKSEDNVLRDVFWAYSGYSFTKDGLCSCIFKGRRAAVRKFLLTLKHRLHSRLSSHGFLNCQWYIECIF